MLLLRPRVALPLLAGLAVAIVVAILALSSGSGGSSTNGDAAGAFDGAALPPGTVAPPFTLTDQDGRQVSLKALRGQVVMIAFLYSTCGATCVLMAQQVRGALDELERPVPVLFVSAYPHGDTPASVRRFLAGVSLTGRVHYLDGPAGALRRVLRSYSIKSATAHERALASFALIALVDRSGNERVLFGIEQLTPEALAHDIGKLERG